MQPIGTAVIVVRNDKVLLGKRKNSYGTGQYGMPGGRVEPGEHLVETARRELYEETGLRAKSLEYVGAVREFQDTYDFIHFTFICIEFEGEPVCKEPEKCEGWEWHSFNNLDSLTVLKGHRLGIELWWTKTYLKDEHA